MAGDFRREPREKNILDNRKLSLSAPVPGVQGKFAALVWSLEKQESPRITVYTNDPNDTKDYGMIKAPMDLATFMMLMALINKAIDAEPGFRDKVDNLNYIYPNGKKSEQPVLISETWVGKDKDGVMWILVSAKDRPKVKFEFQPSWFHVLVHGDGTVYSKAEASVLFARSYTRMLELLMTHLAVIKYKPPEPRPDQGQRGGGGGYGNRSNDNRGGGGGGGDNRGGDRAPAMAGGGDLEDDLPF